MLRNHAGLEQIIPLNKDNRSLLLLLQISVVLGVLSYDSIISPNPLIYYGMRLLFIFSIIVVLYTNGCKIAFKNSIIFGVISALFVYHIFQSLIMDLLWSETGNTLSFLKTIIPRFMYFGVIYIGLLSLKGTPERIVRPIMYLGTLLGVQGLIGVVIVYLGVLMPQDYYGTSVTEMIVIGPFGILGYGNSIYGPIVRAQSIFAEANVLGRFLGVAMWSTLGIYLIERRSKYLMYLLLQGICLVLTFSLAAYIALLVSVYVWWIIKGKRAVMLVKSFVGALVIAGFVILLLSVNPNFEFENETYRNVGIIMSKYTLENLSTERPMLRLAAAYEYLREYPFGEGFSIYSGAVQTKIDLGTGSVITNWIRLGGIISITLWIFLLGYLLCKTIGGFWRNRSGVEFDKCLFMAVIYYLVICISSGSFLETYFLFYLAFISTKIIPIQPYQGGGSPIKRKAVLSEVFVCHNKDFVCAWS